MYAMKTCHMQSQAIDNITKTVSSGTRAHTPPHMDRTFLDSMMFFRENLQNMSPTCSPPSHTAHRPHTRVRPETARPRYRMLFVVKL